MQQVIKANIKRLKTFLNYSKNYLRRNASFKNLQKKLVASLKDALSLNKKRKMVQYKLMGRTLEISMSIRFVKILHLYFRIIFYLQELSEKIFYWAIKMRHRNKSSKQFLLHAWMNLYHRYPMV